MPERVARAAPQEPRRKSRAQLERELGLTPGQIRTWERALERDGQHAFPGTGHQTETEAELRRLRRENEILRQERDILKKAMVVFAKTPDQRLRFEFIKEHEQLFKVRIMCRVLNVSCCGYYVWLRRQAPGQPPAPREMANRRLSDQIWTVFRRSRGTYGSPRIHAELKADGWACSRNRVARLMKKHGIQAKKRQVYKVTTTDSKHNYPVAPNLLGRRFSAERPDEKWLTDITYITYIPTKEGWLYLAAVLDIYSRKVVGWAMDKSMDEGLVERALQMAATHR